MFKTKWVIDKILDAAESFKSINNFDPKIACMGLSYKPDIDDLRESPSIEIVDKLTSMNFDVISVEPNISHHDKYKLTKYNQAIKNADILVYLVAHKEFNKKDLNSMPDKKILDFCGVI